MLLTMRSFARAGLPVNPSTDGREGDLVHLSGFWTGVTMYGPNELGFVLAEVDDETFAFPEEPLHDIQLFGSYGGIRLLKAIAGTFEDDARYGRLAKGMVKIGCKTIRPML